MVAASGWKKALTDATLTIAPPPCSIMAGTAARVARRAVKKFISIAQANSSSLVARNPSRRRRTAPTLLTSTSTRPCSSRPPPTSRAGPSGAARSTRHRDHAVQAVEGVGGPRAGHHVRALVDERPGHGQPDAL